MKNGIVFCLLFLVSSQFLASAKEINSGPKFEQNKCQWPSDVLFKADLYSGRVFFEKNKFTYVYYNMDDLEKNHSQDDSNNKNNEFVFENVHCHSFKVNFLGCSNLATVKGEQIQKEYHNYFIGNDRNKWASNVNVFGQVNYHEIYPAIDLKVYSFQGNLKYDLILNPDADINNIKLLYEGVESISLRGEDLIINTTINEIVEQKPFAYQIINNQKVEVLCKYFLKGNVVSFEILSTYDKSKPIVIDPIIVASTYSGSSSGTYGSCATYDAQGNIYTGGIGFGPGYPVTIGAYNLTFGGFRDIVISKLNSTGSALFFATYLGGSDYEYPQSLFVNSNNELCIYGSSSSEDFPTSTNCYDSSYNGGNFDLVVTHLSDSGNALIGSTFIGGADAEGTYTPGANSGNKSPGEIITDVFGNIFLVSTTKSTNFPFTAGARSWIAGQDVVALKINEDCSSLLWSTCIGGVGDEIGFGIRLIETDDIIITGNTSSADFPTTLGAYQTSYQGGANDGFICRLTTNNAIVSSSFYGTSDEDKSFFIDLDKNNNIYIIGQTDGNIPITSNTYGNAGSKNFIAKLNLSLTTLSFQTVIGNGSSGTKITPSAFFVDDCDKIYFSGFNEFNGVNFGYPLTPDAFYTNPTDGHFYIAELSANANSLNFASFFPGLHVHGGASRFDNQGTLYQATCASTGFPTLPGSFSPLGNQSDIGVVKIDFQTLVADANATVSPIDSGCKPFSANFSSIYSMGRNFLWNFRDGSSIDTSANPLHIFNDTGNFQVQLVVIDSSSCNFSDTFNLNIYVASELIHHSLIDTIICNSSSIILHAANSSPDYSWQWNTNESSDFISVTTPGTYWVNISNGICDVRDSFFVEKLIPPNLGPDTLLCTGQNLILSPQCNGNRYAWSTGDSTSAVTINQENTYWVDVSRQDCILRDSIWVHFAQYPVVHLGNDTSFCPNIEPLLYLDAANPASKALWSTGDTTHNIIASSSGTYWVTVSNAQCSTSDSLIISAYQSKIFAQQDPYFCSYDEAWIDSKVSNVSYLWNTGDTTRKLHATGPGEYWYQISYNGCIEGDTMDVSGPFADNMLWVPSAFTPNGDGKNDVFIPVGSDIQKFEMEIFNRWGKLIYQTNDFTSGWDGRVNYSLAQMGVYTYKIEYSTSCSEYSAIKKGCLLLSQ